MGYVSISGDYDAVMEKLESMATRAVNKAIEDRQPIQPVVQNVIEKTVEHVIDGTPEELRKLEMVKLANNLVPAVFGVTMTGIIVGGLAWFFNRQLNSVE